MLPFDETINGHRLLNTIPVYEVEWLEVNKKTGYLTRHEGVKIGMIFILLEVNLNM